MNARKREQRAAEEHAGYLRNLHAVSLILRAEPKDHEYEQIVLCGPNLQILSRERGHSAKAKAFRALFPDRPFSQHDRKGGIHAGSTTMCRDIVRYYTIPESDRALAMTVLTPG